MNVAFLAITTLGIFAGAAYGSVNTSLLQCTPGNYLTSCKIVDNSLAEKHSIEKEYSVTYTLPCTGPTTTFFLSQEGATDVNLVYTSIPKTVTSVGFGDLKIIDTKPSRTRARPWPRGCELIVSEVTSTYSDKTISRWKEDRANHQLLLDEKKKLMEAYDYLAVLQPGYDLVGAVADLILIDLDVADDLAKFLSAFQTCKTNDNGDKVDCQLFMKLIGDNSDRLTFMEKMFISKLNSTLLQVDPTKPKEIASYLNEEDQALLAAIAEKRIEFADLDEKISTLPIEISKLEVEIELLTKLIEE